MNADYAHLLPGGAIDQKLVGKLLTKEMRRQGHSFRRVAKILGLGDRTVRTVAGGGSCSLETGLKLCIYLDLNPFELFRGVSREMTGSVPCETEARVDG